MHRISAFATLLILAGCATPDPGLSTEDERAVRALEESYRLGWLANDSSLVMATLDPDAVLMPAGVEPLVGASAIREYWWPNDGSVTRIDSYDITIDEIEGSGSVAFLRGRGALAFSYTDAAGVVSNLTSQAAHLSVARRSDTGSWLIARRAWSALPAPPPPADLGFNSYPKFSPDGSRIVFASDRSGNHELYLLDLESRALANITRHDSSDSHASWSPDGQSIAFDSNRAGNREIYLLDLETLATERITNSDGWDGTPTWRRDGSALVFYSERSGNPDLYEVSLSSRELTPLRAGPHDEFYGSWSPEASRLLYETTIQGNRDIAVWDPESGETTLLTTHEGRDHLPGWSRDGRSIIFTSRRDGNDEVYLMSSEGADLVNLSNHSAIDMMASLSPDGSTIVFVSNRGGAFDLYLMDRDGSHVRKLE